MTTVERLMNTGACLQTHLALPLVFEFDPSLEHIDQLKVRLVQVWLTREFLSGRCPDDMSIDTPVRRGLDAEISVLVVRAKPAAFERRILRVRGNESLGRHEEL